tara:strand:+ start:363 stop:545 length:183 start_codon:yes stop_codon:yes gene_type:complete
MIKKIIHILIGVLLVIGGLIGGLFPIVQGWVLGVPGLLILSKYFPPIKRLLTIIKNKFNK